MQLYDLLNVCILAQTKLARQQPKAETAPFESGGVALLLAVS